MGFVGLYLCLLMGNYKEVVFMDNEILYEIAKQLEYDFDNIRILRQAFTRKS